jgi:serine/threonine-protein kinase HipA
MNKVDVLFCGWGQRWTLGTLADNGRQLIFEYSAEALRRGVELSALNLALRREAYGDFPDYLDRLPGLVSDALPDGWGLLLMDRLFAKKGRSRESISPLDRLSFIGERAMGALAFVPPGSDDLSDEDLGLIELASAVQDVIADKDTTALEELALVGGSPHGARPKALVQYDRENGTISTLPEAPGESWLVKFPGQGEHKEVCAVEDAYCTMARRCGLEVPETRFFDIDSKIAAFGIARFDRERGMRVPVHSVAGALHANFRMPALDYSDMLRATRFFTRDATQVEAAFRRCVFNVIFNNRDDHSKNFSFRMTEAMEWKFSPAYDLTFNGGPRGCHQTAVMGEALNPGRTDLLKLAADVGLNMATAEAIIDEMLGHASELQGDFSNSVIRRATATMIRQAVDKNIARCSKLPSAPKSTPKSPARRRP